MEIIYTFWLAVLAGGISATGLFLLWLFKECGIFTRKSIIDAIREANRDLFPKRNKYH